MRGLVAAEDAGVAAAYIEMGLQGLWEEGLKLDDPQVLSERIAAAGLDAQATARRTRRGPRSSRGSPT